MHRDGVADPRDAARRQAQHIDSGPRAQQLERAHVGIVGVELVPRGVADHDRHVPHGCGREPDGAPQPVRPPVRRERPGGRLAAVPSLDLGQRWQHDLLDGPLNRPHRQRRLDRLIGAVALVRAEGADQRVGVRSKPFTRARDGRGDRQPLLERIAERRDLAVREKAVFSR